MSNKRKFDEIDDFYQFDEIYEVYEHIQLYPHFDVDWSDHENLDDICDYPDEYEFYSI